jgi:hypothetical protein
VLLDLSRGRAGDDSLETIGEFVAEVVRFGWVLLAVAVEETDGSRRGLDAG